MKGTSMLFQRCIHHTRKMQGALYLLLIHQKRFPTAAAQPAEYTSSLFPPDPNICSILLPS